MLFDGKAGSCLGLSTSLHPPSPSPSPLANRTDSRYQQAPTSNWCHQRQGARPLPATTRATVVVIESSLNNVATPAHFIASRFPSAPSRYSTRAQSIVNSLCNSPWLTQASRCPQGLSLLPSTQFQATTVNPSSLNRIRPLRNNLATLCLVLLFRASLPDLRPLTNAPDHSARQTTTPSLAPPTRPRRLATVLQAQISLPQPTPTRLLRPTSPSNLLPPSSRSRSRTSRLSSTEILLTTQTWAQPMHDQLISSTPPAAHRLPPPAALPS